MTGQRDQRTIATVRSGPDIEHLKMMTTDRVRRGNSPTLYRQHDSTGEETSVGRHDFFQALTREVAQSGPVSVRIEGNCRTLSMRRPVKQDTAGTPLQETGSSKQKGDTHWKPATATNATNAAAR